MSRLIYPVGPMISCNVHGKILLVEQDDFNNLVKRLLINWNEFDTIAFKVAVYQATAILNAKERYAAWEKEFIDKLWHEVMNNEFNPCYKFEGTEAQKRIEGYLKAFSLSFRCIKVVIALMLNGEDTLFSVSLRAKQGFFDLLFRKYGRSLEEWNFTQTEVISITGSSFNFVVTIKDSKCIFSPSGVMREF